MFFPPADIPQVTDQLIKNQQKYAKIQLHKIKQQKILQQQLINQVLELQPQQRDNSDHQRIWKYFHHFQFFQSIQHDFSLYAKIQAIGHLRKYSQKLSEFDLTENITYLTSDPPQFQQNFAFQHTILDKHKIILLSKDYLKIVKTNQQDIKSKVQHLKKFSCLSGLNYQHFLYLAYSLKRRSYCFKQVIYRTGQQPNQCFLVQTGEFHYIYQQTFQKQETGRYDNKDKSYSQIKKSKNKNSIQSLNNSILISNQSENNSPQKDSKTKPSMKKSSKKLKKMKAEQLMKYDNPSPNRVYKKSKKDSKLAIILSGSCFGQQQLVSNCQRLYKAQCMSTQNQVFIIKKQHFLNLLKQVPQFKKSIKLKIKNQNLQKNGMISKIKQTKINLKKYIKQIQKSTEKLNKSIHEEISQLKDLSKSRQILKSNQSQINESVSGLPYLSAKRKAYSNVVAISRLNQINNNASNTISIGSLQNRKKSTQNISIQQQYSQQGFALTNIHENYEEKRTVQLVPYKQEGQIQFRKPAKLPLISAVSSPSHSFNDVIQFKIGKSWSSKKDKLLKMPDKSKYVGMIDSQTLIKQKQYIIAKQNKLQKRKAIFPQYQNHLSKTNINLALKKAGSKTDLILKSNGIQRQKQKSVAHSKNFMQKLLVDALQKSGYTSVKNQQSQFGLHNQKSSQTLSYNSQSAKKNTEGGSYLFKRPKNKKPLQNFFGSDMQYNSMISKQNQKKNTFLQSNAFDKCYFKKI